MNLPSARRTVTAIIAGLSVFFASGCAPTHQDTESHNGKIVINFWNGFTGPDGKTMTAMVKQFQVENPDVEVKMQIIPWGTYYDKLTLSLVYGGAPDVFIMQTARFSQYASYNTLKPMQSFLDHATPPLKETDFAPRPWRAAHYNGNLYALPLDIFPIGMYYNTKLFKDAGIVDAAGNAKPPTNLQEFVEDAKKLTKDTDGDGRPDQWGYVITNQHSNLLTFAHQFGGDILTPDGKQGAMSSPEFLQGTRLLCDMVYKYKVAPKPEGIDAWLAFRQGKVGMAMEGIYMLSNLQEQTSLHFSGAPIPQFGPVKGIWGGSHMLCMPATITDQHAQAAWKLMSYLSKHSITWAAGGQVPARLAVEKSPEFKDLTVQAQFARQIDYVVYDPQVPKAAALNQFADPAIEAALTQLQTPEDAMRDADRRINQLLKRP